MLFVPDGLDRVEVGGLPGRVPAEEDADDRADQEGDHDAPRLDEDWVGENGLHDRALCAPVRVYIKNRL